jgi:hypothetical protein
MNASAMRMPLRGSPPTIQYGLSVTISVFFFAAMLQVSVLTWLIPTISFALLYYYYAGSTISILAVPAFPTTKN